MIANAFCIENDLVLEFFVAFSRFEYALKRAGFATGNEKGVKADWDCFGQNLRRTAAAEELAPVLNCCTYLRQNPPKKQILRAGQLAWNDGRGPSRSDIERLLIDIRCVRNNLFHGGKIPIPDGPVEEEARNKRLLHDSLAAMKKILD